MDDLLIIRVNDEKQRVGLFIRSMGRHHFELTAEEAVAMGERLLHAAVSLIPTIGATPLLIDLLNDPPSHNQKLRALFKKHYDAGGLVYGEDWQPLINRDPATLTDFEKDQIVRFFYVYFKPDHPNAICSNCGHGPACHEARNDGACRNYRSDRGRWFIEKNNS